MESSKADLFNNISWRYDFLNHLFSMGIDRMWRKNMIRKMGKGKPKHILDIATGTGDLVVEMAKHLRPKEIIALDPAEKMLAIAKKKLKKKKIHSSISFTEGIAENLPFNANTFDAVTVGFGVRNFDNLQKGLKEIHRVLKAEGQVLILEFSHPKSILIRPFYLFYLSIIMPSLAFIFTGNFKEYRYLYHSVKAFPHGDDFLAELEQSGFKNSKQKKLTFGIASLYTSFK